MIASSFLTGSLLTLLIPLGFLLFVGAAWLWLWARRPEP
jgi:hypothetical protein